MTCLVDTNILLRLTQTAHPMRPSAQKAINLLSRQKQDFYIAPQNLNEFYVVATRPHSSNGSGLSCEEAFEEIQEYKQVFKLLSDRGLNNSVNCKVVSPSPQPSPNLGEGARVWFPFSQIGRRG